MPDSHKATNVHKTYITDRFVQRSEWTLSTSNYNPGRQAVRWLWWVVFRVETWSKVGGKRGRIRVGFVKEQCFKFGVKALRRDSKR